MTKALSCSQFAPAPNYASRRDRTVITHAFFIEQLPGVALVAGEKFVGAFACQNNFHLLGCQLRTQSIAIRSTATRWAHLRARSVREAPERNRPCRPRSRGAPCRWRGRLPGVGQFAEFGFPRNQLKTFSLLPRSCAVSSAAMALESTPPLRNMPSGTSLIRRVSTASSRRCGIPGSSRRRGRASVHCGFGNVPILHDLRLGALLSVSDPAKADAPASACERS